mgnify:FL=1
MNIRSKKFGKDFDMYITRICNIKLKKLTQR